jgi:hypothetical protein
MRLKQGHSYSSVQCRYVCCVSNCAYLIHTDSPSYPRTVRLFRSIGPIPSDQRHQILPAAPKPATWRSSTKIRNAISCSADQHSGSLQFRRKYAPRPIPGSPPHVFGLTEKQHPRSEGRLSPKRWPIRLSFCPVSAGCSSGRLAVLFPGISPPPFTFSILFLFNLALRSLFISFLFRPIPKVPPKNSFMIGAAHYTLPLLSFSACIKSY